MKYPKQVYVRAIKDGNKTYFVAAANLEEFDEEGTVATYELVQVDSLSINRELRPTRALQPKRTKKS